MAPEGSCEGPDPPQLLASELHATPDGQLVVLQDSTLDRTADGTGAVFETDWATSAGVDAGGRTSPPISVTSGSQPRMTFAASTASTSRSNSKGYGEAFSEEVIRAIRTADVLDRVEFTGWNLLLLSMLKRGTPLARIGLSLSRQPL